jgi:hypothetical protein
MVGVGRTRFPDRKFLLAKLHISQRNMELINTV